MPSRTFFICDAYEAGVGKGQARSTDKNPYRWGSEEHQAWDLGYSKGLTMRALSEVVGVNAIALHVLRATVLTGRGTDKISLDLDLPTPFPEMNYQASCSIEARHGYGVQWCSEVLGITPEAIAVNPGAEPL